MFLFINKGQVFFFIFFFHNRNNFIFIFLFQRYNLDKFSPIYTFLEDEGKKLMKTRTFVVNRLKVKNCHNRANVAG
jgi:hypothetical protein